MKKNIVKMSLAAVMVLSTGAYAGKIIGANASDPYVATTPPTQSSFDGWDLTDVVVKMTDTDYIPISKNFNPGDGTYDVMIVGDSFESQIMTDGEHRGNLHGKDWPVGEPAGLKIINNDDKVQNGKPFNCIMTTSYLSELDNPLGGNGYLDAAFDSNDSTTPSPTICSSAFQTHKRFKINMLESMVAGKNPGDYGNPVDIVFNLDKADTNTDNVRYQVLQKINNYTGMRLDGYKIEVLAGDSKVPHVSLTLSLGIGEDEGDDIWTWDSLATFSHGLWGPADGDHFLTDGFFDKVAAGFKVSGHGTNTIVGGTSTLNGLPNTLGSNYNDLWGSWLPSKWQPTGVFWDDDNDRTTDAQLMAYWGTIPGAPAGTAPAWHKGQGDNWAEPTESEFLAWMESPLYALGHIEDTLNVGLNYIVNVGTNADLNNTFTIRITPHIAVDQTPPSYADDNVSIDPDPPVITDGTVAIAPIPTFLIGATLTLSVKDEDQNLDLAVKDTTTVTVTTDTGDKETVTLTEDDVNSSIFVGTIVSELTTSSPVQEDGKMNVIKDAVVTVTYVDNAHSDTASTVSTVLDDGDDSTDSDGDSASSGGGGCTYNPNSNSFDMTFLILMAMGLLYPFRRKFIK